MGERKYSCQKEKKTALESTAALITDRRHTEKANVCYLFERNDNIKVNVLDVGHKSQNNDFKRVDTFERLNLQTFQL